MTVLNYVYHQNVAGGRDTLDKVRTFAVAQGWTQEEWVDGYAWDDSSPFGFTIVDADAAFLELSSGGYGSGSGTQNLVARLEHLQIPTCSNHRLMLNMTNGSAYTLQSDSPIVQNQATSVGCSRYYLYGAMHIGEATYDDLWLFGNDKVIVGILSMDGIYVQHFWFGSFIPFEDDPTEGAGRGLHMNTREYPDDTCPEWQYWSEDGGQIGWAPYFPGFRSLYAGNRIPAIDFYWDGASIIQPYNACSLNINLWLDDTGQTTDKTPVYLSGIFDSQTGYEVFLNVGPCLRTNSYSNKRPMLRAVYFGKRSSDSVWQPFCKTPFYFLNTAGLTIGQTLTYGSEQFLCFPIGPYHSPIGVGMQIA